MRQIDPSKYYIDRRKGIDMTVPKSHYLGSEWERRGYSEYFMVEVFINENGVFIEVSE